MAISVTVLQLFFNSLAAYVFAKRQFPGRNVIFLLFLATMMIPGQITLIPNYLVIKHIPLFGGNDILGQGGSGWLDSYWGLILPGSVSAFGIFLLRQYMTLDPRRAARRGADRRRERVLDLLPGWCCRSAGRRWRRPASSPSRRPGRTSSGR